MMQINTTTFSDGGSIPKQFTGDGKNLTPELRIRNIPATAKTLAIVVDDPDAPNNTFTHWVAWNIPLLESIQEGTQPGVQGQNDAGSMGYMGPLPPKGNIHRYFFKLFALDTTLDLREGSSRKELETAMKGHIVGEAKLMGRYAR